MVTRAARALHPELLNSLSGFFDMDVRPQEAAGIEASAPYFAAALCMSHVTSSADRVRLRNDVRWLLDGGREAILELDTICCHSWNEDPAELAALNAVLAESLRALDVRIAWEARRVDDPTDVS